MFLIRFALNSNKSNSHDFTPNTLQACRLPSNMTGKSMPGEEDRRMAEINREQKLPARKKIQHGISFVFKSPK